MSSKVQEPRLNHEGTILKDRFTSKDIFERILQVAGEEVDTGPRELFFSALAAGFAICLTFYLYATMSYQTDGHAILSGLLYPLGFMYIVLGNYQLYTENTLPPVALTIERLSSVPSMLYVWSIVLAGNLLGGFIGAAGLANLAVFSTGAAEAALSISMKAFETGWWMLFNRGVLAGFIVAGLVWLDYASRDTAARFFQVYFAFFTIVVANLNHSVVTAVEAIYLYFVSNVSLLASMTDMVLPVLLGNTIGGVVFVTIINYFQTPEFILQDPSVRIGWKEWLFEMKTFRDTEE